MFLQFQVSGIPSLLLLILCLPPSQSSPEELEPNQNRQRKTSDPVSNFFSELGDLILDVDQTVAVQSRPKIEHEGNIVSQLFRPRPDYFNRIQKNYNDMQKRLGKLIGDTIGFKNTYSEHELSTVNPPLENFVPTIEPDYNPFAAAAEARKEKLKQRVSKGSNENLKDPVELFFEPKGSIPRAIPETFEAFGKLSKAIIDDIGDLSGESTSRLYIKEKEKCSNEVLEDPILEQRRQKKCSRMEAKERARADLRKLMLEPKRATETLFSESTKALDQLSKGIFGRSDASLIENNSASVDGDPDKGRVNTEASKDECSSEVLEDATLENIRKEKCIAAEERLITDLNKLLLDSRRASERLIPVGSKAINDLSTILLRRGGDVQAENLGDLLYSDSSLDKQIRQLIKDHGSWILDYPLLKRWRQRERSSGDNVMTTDQNSEQTDFTTLESTSHASEIEPTEVYVPVSTDYEMPLRKSGEAVPESPHETSYYRIVNDDGDVMEEEIDIVLDPESLDQAHDIEAVEFERQEQKETVILAFTSDGVPLKLRLGPEIDNPLQYLHNALKSASVSLNIPVESYDDLEPVGKEVLKLGYGILTRAVLINVSNSNELKSLLKALMVSKSSGKTPL